MDERRGNTWKGKCARKQDALAFARVCMPRVLFESYATNVLENKETKGTGGGRKCLQESGIPRKFEKRSRKGSLREGRDDSDVTAIIF